MTLRRLGRRRALLQAPCRADMSGQRCKHGGACMLFSTSALRCAFGQAGATKARTAKYLLALPGSSTPCGGPLW